jgi:hypothetical protein
MTEPLEDHEQREITRVGPEIAKTKASLKIKEIRLRKLQEQAVREKSAADQERCAEEAASLAAEISATSVLAAPRYIADDCTTERLATLLQDQGGRIAVMSAEGDVFDLMAGRYSPTASANFGVYLKGHAGDALRVDRVPSTVIRLPRASPACGRRRLPCCHGPPDLMPDGKRFVIQLNFAHPEFRGAADAHVTFLLNFADELRRKVPTAQ